MTGFENHKIALIGFGEAAIAFVQGWNASSEKPMITAYDIKTDDPNPQIQQAKTEDYKRMEVAGRDTLKQALEGADVVFSLVTADQAEAVADAAAPLLDDDTFFLDCNSCSPGAKIRNFAKITETGGRYVDVAVMAPVHPKLHQTPVSLCGPYATGACDILNSFDMKATHMEGEIGTSSSLKMIRSIMVKGMEALMAECVLAGQQAGMAEEVLESLEKTYPGFDFKNKAAYMLERSMTHGIRRAAEMREVAITVDDLGLNGDMARATVQWQQRLGDIKLQAIPDEGYEARAQRLLSALLAETNMKDA